MNNMDVKEAIDFALDCHKKGELNQAKEIYKKILEANPDIADAWHLLGLVEHQQHNYSEALKLITKAISLRGDIAVYYGNLGMVYDKLGLEEESIKSFEKALELDPYYKNSFMAHYNLGISYSNIGEFEQAIEHYTKAAELKKDFFDAYWNRGLILLLLGDYLNGWRDYEFRFKKESPTDSRVFGKPRWQGENISGKRILVESEQGFGDSIQFVRFLPKLKEKGAYVILECKKELTRLYKGLEGVDELIDKKKNSAPNIDFDFYIHLLSLPFIFGTTLESIPKKVPYITRELTILPETYSKLKTGKFRIGLCWAGNPDFPNDKFRSINFEMLKHLLEIPGIQFFSLQLGEASKQLDDPRVVNLKEDIYDFYDTAAIINNLDLIISTDTSVPHLAGALGKRVWILLSHIPDWRWMIDREDSVWYPTMRLFRQKKRGDWEEVIQNVKRELKELVKT